MPTVGFCFFGLCAIMVPVMRNRITTASAKHGDVTENGEQTVICHAGVGLVQSPADAISANLFLDAKIVAGLLSLGLWPHPDEPASEGTPLPNLLPAGGEKEPEAEAHMFNVLSGFPTL